MEVRFAADQGNFSRGLGNEEAVDFLASPTQTTAGSLMIQFSKTSSPNIVTRLDKKLHVDGEITLSSSVVERGLEMRPYASRLI